MSLRNPWRGAAVVALGGLGLALGSCARGPTGPPRLESLAATYESGVARRESRLSAFEGDLVVRVDGRATGRLPGVLVRTRVASPDRARLEASALVGTALDVCARGDSLTAWLPSQRAAVQLDARRDSLGVRAPGRFYARALGATWRPPHAAWAAATRDSDGVRVTWSEAEGDWSMRVTNEGRPDDVVLLGASPLHVRYGAWQGTGDAAWPARFSIADDGGWVRVRIDVEDTHFANKPDDGWFTLALPPGARRYGVSDLRRVLAEARAKVR